MLDLTVHARFAEYPVWIAMAALYLMLGICSIAVGIATRASPGSQLRSQVYAWWLIFPFVSLCIFLYPFGPLLLMLLISGLAVHELVTHDSGHGDRHALFRLTCLLMLALVLGLTYRQPGSASLLAGLVLAQLLVFVFRRDSRQLLLLLFFVCCCGLSFLIQFTQLPFPAQTNLAWLFYLFALTALNDIAQFVSGKCFGRQKIARRISPNKTWQGLAGGIAVCVLVSALLGSYLQLASLPYLISIAVLLSLGGFAGDLLFSAGKRYLQIKDYSQLIPGHGGILDRVDSLVVTAPLLYQLIYFSHTGYLQ
ncbi:phosphatidate cytidylyltransferase [Undibacterium sp.]|uniref:phosphatidate cytidylyltransferase n=1 Tax=Undibacterium sp. TaxID=1914977 RepID=UPI00374C982A